MTDLKELRKLIKLCRDSGVTHIRYNGVELSLGEPPIPHIKLPKENTESILTNIAPGGITADTRILTEELTEEQLLFYSAGGNQ